MAKFTFFYGTQAYEFERPDIVTKPGAKVQVTRKTYTLAIKPTSTKVVIVK